MNTKDKKTEVQDRVRILMPKDREYQFPAIAVVQAFMREYEARGVVQDVSQGKVHHNLFCTLEMSAEDLEYFRRAGVSLEQLSDAAAGISDMVIDLTDDRLNRFRGCGKNVWQICNILSGAQTMQYMPITRQVRPAMDRQVWKKLGSEISDEDLFTVKDDELTGVIGLASPASYLACCMGLGVVEILPAGRPSSWLSKWVSPFYRMIGQQGLPDELLIVERAKDSIHMDMIYLRDKQKKEAA